MRWLAHATRIDLSRGLQTGQACRIIAWEARGRDVAGTDKDPGGLHLTPYLARVHFFYLSPPRTWCIRLSDVLLDTVIFLDTHIRPIPKEAITAIVTIIALIVG